VQNREQTANQFVQQEFVPGDIIAQLGQPIDRVFPIAHGKVNKITPGKYEEESLLGTLADGDHFGGQTLVESESSWQ
jgi:signal-transduction protein with cAMP-binding, CBS, and nucleotidyltransferase domain